VNTTAAKEASVGEVITIGLDLARSIFQAHGADASGEVVFRKKLRRDQVLAFWSRWRPAPAPNTGRARSELLATRPSSSRRPM
jgi:hypothetical protein